MKESNRIAEIIVNRFNDLYKSSYNLSISNDYYRTSVSFNEEKEEINNTFRFLIEQDSNDNIIIYGFIKEIAYFKVEKILVPILSKNRLRASDSNYKNRLQTFKIDLKDKHRLPEEGKKIENEADIKYVSDLFIKFYKEDALPYFNHWNNVTVLYEYIKTKKDEELWDILGQFAPMKKAVIYRLCNDELALKIMNNYYEEQKGYYEEDPNDEDNIRYYNTSKELKEILENTEPIYNVEV